MLTSATFMMPHGSDIRRWVAKKLEGEETSFSMILHHKCRDRLDSHFNRIMFGYKIDVGDLVYFTSWHENCVVVCKTAETRRDEVHAMLAKFMVNMKLTSNTASILIFYIPSTLKQCLPPYPSSPCCKTPSTLQRQQWTLFATHVS